MKLDVGMYIRTDNGIIEKVNKIYDSHTTDNMVVWLNGYGDGKSVFIDDFEEVKYLSINARGFIKKEPSFDIIDLIEKGDYVNGRKVYQVGYNFQDDFVLKMGKSNYDDFIYPNEIETIVTHEQMEQMVYKVGNKYDE